MKKVELVYEIKWLIDLIYSESDKLLYKIIDTTKFEERCIKELGEYLAIHQYNKNNKKHLIRLVKRKVKEAETWYKKEEAISISELTTIDEEDKEVEFEPIDVLANVESEVIAKEMTALLAQDGRRKTVVEAWVIGNTNDKKISSTLARTLGGNQESHRKFIQRFRNECRERLSAVI